MFLCEGARLLLPRGSTGYPMAALTIPWRWASRLPGHPMAALSIPWCWALECFWVPAGHRALPWEQPAGVTAWVAVSPACQDIGVTEAGLAEGK